MTLVTLRLEKAAGVPAARVPFTVRLRPTTPLTLDLPAAVQGLVSEPGAKLGADGTAVVTLTPTQNLVPSGMVYEATFRPAGTPVVVMVFGGWPVNASAVEASAWVTPLPGSVTPTELAAHQADHLVHWYELNTAPSSPTLGFLWLDTSTTPSTPKRWTGTAWETLGGTGGGGGAGVGDAIRIYNNVGTQAIANGVSTKVTVFDTQLGPASGWPVADYGDFSGGTTFAWDATGKRVSVLRDCVVYAFVNADCNPVDVRLVDPATGKQDPAAPTLAYNVRMSSGGSINLPTDGTIVPATRAVGSQYGTGGGNTGLPVFNAKAGDYLEFWVVAFGASITLTYADITFRCVANIGAGGGGGGTNGLSVLNGTGAPAAGVGVNGEFYIDTMAKAIYGPKTAGAWGSPTSLIGPAGATGSTGPQGSTGATGPAGVAAATAPVTYNSGTQTVGISIGTTAGTVAAGNDGRFTDSRTPTAHAASHASAGSDAVALAASQVTSGVFNIARLATGTPDGTKFVRDDGTLATPAGGSAPVYPWLIDIDVLMTPILNVGAWSPAQRAYIHGGILNNGNGALGDNAGWDVVLGAATWTLEVMRYQGGDSGKETWALDDGAGTFTDLGIIDDYSGAGGPDQLASITGIVIASTIKRRLRVTSSAKNGSSSGQYLRIQHVQLRRTA